MEKLSLDDNMLLVAMKMEKHIDISAHFQMISSPIDRFRKNLRAASQIKLEPEVRFSGPLASYVRHLASYEQSHPDAMAISLLNIVAITSRNSSMLRRGKTCVSLNLYNFVVARSGREYFECDFKDFLMIGYGKSDILSCVERAVKQSVRYHAHKYATMSVKRENSQGNEMIKKKGKVDTENFETVTDKRTNLMISVPRVIFNDGTGAGILNQLDSCTRALCLYEADTTMGSGNVFQSGPFDRTPSRLDSFRSTLMTLYEEPGNFSRLLKNELIHTERSKLVLLVSNSIVANYWSDNLFFIFPNL